MTHDNTDCKETEEDDGIFLTQSNAAQEDPFYDSKQRMLQRLNDYGDFVQYNKISALFGGLRHQTNTHTDIEQT